MSNSNLLSLEEELKNTLVYMRSRHVPLFSGLTGRRPSELDRVMQAAITERYIEREGAGFVVTEKGADFINRR